MNATAERLAAFSLLEQQPLPDIAHFPYIDDCQNLLASNESFTPEEKTRFAKNLLILSNRKHESWYPSKPGAIVGEDYLNNFWNFAIKNNPYRNGWSLDFSFEDINRELVLGEDGINTIHNTPKEEGVRAWNEEVDDTMAKQWLGKALEVILHNKEVDARVRYGRAERQQHDFTRFSR